MCNYFLVTFCAFSYAVLTILWHSMPLLYVYRNYKMCKCLSVNLVSARSCKQSWSWNLRLWLDSIAGLSRWDLIWEDIYTRQLEDPVQPVCLQRDRTRKCCVANVRCLHSGGMCAVPVRWVVQWPFPDLPMKLEDWGCGVTAAHVDGCWMV